MKNIHILSTDKPSRLWMDSDNNLNLHLIPTTLFKMQNIYITSDEEIKEGDWILDTVNGIIEKVKFISKGKLINGCWVLKSCKKIILTTDQDLIKHGVQGIDDEFLEWFVKNPSCEEVEVKIECTNCDDCNCQYHDPCLKPKYNIVKDMIRYSKEEPKQEPGREIADYIDRHIVEALVEVAKQKMYSEEEIKQIIKSCQNKPIIVENQLTNKRVTSRNWEFDDEYFDKWFEQFKKKNDETRNT
jgi:hypothetical protein